MTGEPRQTLELDPTVVSSPDGSVPVDGDGRMDSTRICRVESRRVTSPTRMPLNRTADPLSNPDTEPSKRTR